MSNSTPKHQFGRLPRRFNPRVPHLSVLRSAVPAPSMPADFGMMLNDRLGDCTCAAYYHARQVWTWNGRGKEQTEPDLDVERLYIEACGYNPLIPGPGPGGDEQTVLNYLLNTGAPTGLIGQSRDKIVAFVEVDPRNIDDVKRTIFECGAAYIGFPVPANVNYDNPVCDYDPNAAMTGDGHAVVLVGYSDAGANAISWGKLFTLTWAFITNIVEEVYAIADNSWIEATGMTPCGLTLQQLELQMQALKESVPP